jgi:hypothetical protein
VYSLNGQKLYSASGNEFNPAVLTRLCGGQTVVVRFRFSDGREINQKLFVK